MPDWMTVDEAAEALDYHPEYVRMLLRDGRLGGKKHAAIWLVSGEDVRELQQILADQDAEGMSKYDPRRGRKEEGP